MDEIGSNQVRPRRIGVLALPGFALMSFASTTEPFRAANLLSGQPLYQLVHLTTGTTGAASSGAAVLGEVVPLAQAPALDYLFVVAGGDPVAYRDARVFGWLHRQARTGVTLGGVSGGPVVLARAGLMQGRRMTVHWEHAAALSEIAPDLLLERTLYVIDRDRMTCAGGIAPLDMIHALIAGHHGAPFAQLVSDWFLHTEIRPSVGPQRGGFAARLGTTNRPVLDAARAMDAHVAEPLTLDQLASIVGLSPRQLNRHFQTHMRRSAMAVYLEIRLEKALSLLRHSALTLTEIALATGFANPSHFSKRFAIAYGQPPSAFRRSLSNNAPQLT